MHPSPQPAASQYQTPRNTVEGMPMSKLLNFTAAFVLFAPFAFALLAQAAQIVA
jgi:hypothetical protein